MDGMGGLLLNNDLNGAKRLNGWNDWNGCSFIHRVLIVRVEHEHVFSPTTHDHGHEHGSSYFPCFLAPPNGVESAGFYQYRGVLIDGYRHFKSRSPGSFN